MDLSLGMGEEPNESLPVRAKEQMSMGGIVIGAYHRPPAQEGRVDEAFAHSY